MRTCLVCMCVSACVCVRACARVRVPWQRFSTAVGSFACVSLQHTGPPGFTERIPSEGPDNDSMIPATRKVG